jgi:hypothetical protein
MTSDEFRAELRDALTSVYEDILKVPGAGGRPQPMIIKRRFAPKPATGVQATDSDSAPVPAASRTGSDSRAPNPVRGARTPPGSGRSSGSGQIEEGSKGPQQGWQLNKPVCACIGVFDCTVHEICAFSRAKFQSQNPAGQP